MRVCVIWKILLHTVHWAEVDGVLYKKKCALVTGVGVEHPEFAQLEEIYVVNSKKVLFDLQPLETVNFNEHFHSFVVQPVLSHNPHVYLCKETLLSPIPHHVRVLPASIGTLCIVPKHHIVINCS